MQSARIDPIRTTLAWCFVVAIILLSICTHLWNAGKKKKMMKLPPGPPGWPIVGNLFQLGRKPIESLLKLEQRYGPLMSLQLGMKTTVVVSSPAMAKEVLKNNDHVSAFRTVPQSLECLPYNESSIVWGQYGPRWRLQRRIFSTGFMSASRLNAMEHLRRAEVFQTVRSIYMDCLKGQTVNIWHIAFLANFNLIGNMIFTQNIFDPYSRASQEFMETIRKAIEIAVTPNLADLFPFLRFLDPQGIRRGTAVYVNRLFKLCDKLIEDRLASSKQSDDPPEATDFLGVLMDFRISDADSDGDTAKFSRTDINALILELFAAGSETTSTVIEWAMAELIRNPHTIQRAQAELEDVVGRDRKVGELDIPHLSYLHAVVKEIFRLHPPGPLLIPHRAADSFNIAGFVIPKDAQIMVNVWAIGRDPSIWSEPLEFVPERFMQSTMEYKGNHFELIPFGAGRRICPGLPLANRMVLLVLASLLHSFDWCLPGNQRPEQMDMTQKFGSTLHKAVPLMAIPKPRLPIVLYSHQC